MSSQAAVILAAGKGTRMKSRVPKVLHRVCGREMVGLVADAAEATGFDPTIVVVGPDSQAVRDALEDRVAYAVQPEPRGSGDALLHSRALLDGVNDIAVLYGDVPLIRPETLRSMMRLHLEKGACITLLTTSVDDPEGLGRVIRDAHGGVTAIIEDREADDEVRAVPEVNSGVYCFRTSWLWPTLQDLAPSSNGEIYLTDLVSLASRQGMVIESVRSEGPQEVIGVNTRAQLAEAEAALRQQLREKWMLAGVTLADPASVYLDFDVELGRDTVVLPNTHITRGSRIGQDCEIGPNAIVDGAKIGDRCRVVASVVQDSTLEDDVAVGPFSRVRSGSHLETGVLIGSSVEVKQSRLGRGSRSLHFSYVGDAEVGANVNIGAGTVTCNFDGVRKHVTRIEDDAFIGSDSMLVAPVTIGARSSTGAGAVVTRDVPPDTLVVGVPAKRAQRAAARTGTDGRRPAVG